jgi:C-terminal processing protease CtpA/Prc
MHRDDKSPTTVTIKRDAIPLISVKARELEPG